MADLEVDMGLLGGTVSSLGSLITAFNGIESQADDYHDAIGASDMQGAVHTFATNWKTHREKLTSSVQAVHDMAKKSHDTFTQADEELAQQLIKDSSTRSETIGHAQ